MTLSNSDRLRKRLQNPNAYTSVTISPIAERAQRPDNPLFLRLGDLAIALAPANGHTNFGHDELLAILEVRDRRTLDKAIAEAIRYGVLAPGSSQRCLELPAGVTGLCLLKNPNARETAQSKPCAVCHGRPRHPASCHPDKPVHAKGLCNGCYRAKRRAENGTD